MTRYAFFTLPLLLLGVSCADDRNTARTATGPAMALTASQQGANSTTCAAYNKQLTLANDQLGISPGNTAIQHRISVLTGAIRTTCS